MGPGACPHLGAALCDAPVHGDDLVCRWHGLALGPGGRPGWRTLPAFDDGVLAWVRLDDLADGPVTEAPVLGPRPPAGLDAVATVIGHCEPQDVIANRLDPWHGAWLHPYSFTALKVLSAPPLDCPPAEDRFLVEVTFTLGKRFGVPVHAAFSCPDPRTVTMEIVDGEGAGSVVETHATPLRPDATGRPRTAVIEAVVAHSDRPGFAVTHRVAGALRPLIAHTAARLWRDDIAYAERRHALRATPAVRRLGLLLRFRPSGGVSGSGARLPRNVCTMCCCQPGNVCTFTSTNPVACIRVVNASTPSKSSTLRHRYL